MSISQIVPINQKNQPNFGENQGVWEYRTIDNEFLCYVVRKSNDKGKYFLPWTMQNGKWVNKWFVDTPKPLYNLPLLRLFPFKPVLLVEGEKTADHAASLFPDFNVLSWMGGSSSCKKIEVDYLAGLKIYLLPDNDKPGYEAMVILKERLLPIASTVYFIDIKKLPVPEKWDLADIDMGDIDLDDIKQLIQSTHPISINNSLINRSSFPLLTEKGNPINAYENLEYICNHYKINISFNIIRKEIVIVIPHKSFTLANKPKLDLAELTGLCIKNGMPRSDIIPWLTMIADKNSFNPVEKFISSKPWDGVPRINEFMNTIQCTDNKARDIYIYRWMIGAIAVALSPSGMAHPGVLTFVSKQAKGKSSWTQKLLPEELNLILGEFILNPDDKDSVIRATKYWIVELAEADATVNKSEASSQKAFLTRKTDQYRCPYDRTDTEAPRHTCFIGTVNDAQFLKDETGNRRWWVLDVIDINYKHSLDMQQVWAEFKTHLDRGEQFHLTDSELDILMEQNEQYRPSSAIEEAIRLRYSWNAEERNRKHTALQVLVDCGFDIKINKNSQTKEANRVLRALCEKKPKKIDGLFYYYLPPQRGY